MKIAILIPFLHKSEHEKSIRLSIHELTRKLSGSHQVTLFIVHEDRTAWSRSEKLSWKNCGAQVRFICSGNGETYGDWAPCNSVWSQSTPVTRDAACVYAHLRTGYHDAVIFPDFKGVAYACLQAKVLGVSFSKTIFHCWMLGSHEWLRFSRQIFRTEVSLKQVLYHDVYEQYSVAHADVLWSEDPSLPEWHRQARWTLPSMERAGEPRPDCDHSPKENEKLLPETSGALPLVSLLVPHYNSGDTLPETLGSLAAQTYGNLEIRILDDGSTDADSLEAFHREAGKYREDPRFHFTEEPNRDVGAARNSLAARTTADFFIFVDPDNICPPEMTSKLVSATLHSGCDALTCYRYVFKTPADIEARRFHALAIHSGGHPVLGLWNNSFGDTNSCIRRKAFEAVGGFQETPGLMHHDWDVLCRMALNGARLECYPEPLFYYRLNPKGMSHSRDRFAAKQRILDNYCAELPPWARTLLRSKFPFIYHPNHLVGFANHGISQPGHLQKPENEIRRSWSWKLAAPLYKTERWLRSFFK